MSNFHKTTSECWQRTPGTQKGCPFSSKGGRTKYERQKQRQKSQGWRPILGRKSRRGRSSQIVRTFSQAALWGSFGISEGNITKKEKKKKTQNTHLTATASGEVAQMLVSITSKRGLGKEA